ncbi:DMT family transporter [Sphingomonas sp.]|uniref:DMT family transporter n=1 Tax=Sphingomonas sp. TaxID=28214 RepID=UPI0025E0572E|nr:DMT family transporter [Sphingomonas sp.]
MHRPSLPTIFFIGTLGIATFSGMDAVMKGLSLAIGTYNALFWRMWAASLCGAIVWAMRRPKAPSRAAVKLHLTRGAVGATMAFLFFWGLARVPMAQAIALSYIAPLLALFLAAMILGERIGRGVVGASLIASAGVGVILIGQAQSRLGDEAFLGALSILASAVCYSWNIVLMRQQAQVASPEEVGLFQSLVAAVLLSLPAPWLAELPPVREIGPILLAAVLSTVSLMLLSWAYARAEAQYLAPTEYTSFVWAALLGWVVFGEHVSLYTLAGAGLIVGGCLIAARMKPQVMTHEAEAALP